VTTASHRVIKYTPNHGSLRQMKRPSVHCRSIRVDELIRKGMSSRMVTTRRPRKARSGY
jgi:hypothetical protein